MPHILENIFLSLDYKLFMTCLEVSNTWNELLSSESYQRKGKTVFQDEIPEYQEKLWLASMKGDSVEVRRLLKTGILDGNCDPGRYRATPLHQAVEWGHEDLVQLLLERGADIKKESLHVGETPLHWAVRNGHNYLRVVQLLLDGGADPNKESIDGLTPLHWAADTGH